MVEWKVGIVDSGAECSLISSSLANELNLDISDGSHTLKVVGQDNFNTVGSVMTDINIHGVEMKKSQFIVYPNVINTNISLLPGSDFLRLNNIELCIRKRILIKHYNHGGHAEIYIDQSGKSRSVMLCGIPCYAAKDVNICQGQVQRVPIACNIPANNCDDLFLYSDCDIDQRLSDRVHGLPGVLDIRSKFILMSSVEASTTIKKGQSLGSFSTVLQLPDNESWPMSDGTDANIGAHLLLPHLPLDQQTEVFTMFNKYKSVFSTGDSDIGLASVTQHHIELTDHTPIYQ